MAGPEISRQKIEDGIEAWLYGGDPCPVCGAELDYGEDEPGEPYLIHPDPQCGWAPDGYPAHWPPR